MEYEAPKLVEVGSVEDLTLGRLSPGPAKDNTIWWAFGSGIQARASHVRNRGWDHEGPTLGFMPAPEP